MIVALCSGQEEHWSGWRQRVNEREQGGPECVGCHIPPCIDPWKVDNGRSHSLCFTKHLYEYIVSVGQFSMCERE